LQAMRVSAAATQSRREGRWVSVHDV
jgi:hypothetical protein